MRAPERAWPFCPLPRAADQPVQRPRLDRDVQHGLTGGKLDERPMCARCRVSLGERFRVFHLDLHGAWQRVFDTTPRKFDFQAIER
jgi:hypothetical protein